MVSCSSGPSGAKKNGGNFYQILPVQVTFTTIYYHLDTWTIIDTSTGASTSFSTCTSASTSTILNIALNNT